MTELTFYKFIKEWNPEYRWDKNNNQDDVIFWISPVYFDEFYKLVESPSLFDEGGIEVRLVNGGLAFWASTICDHYDIDMKNVFEK